MAALGPLILIVTGAIFGLDVGETLPFLGLPFLGPPIVLGFGAALAVRKGATWGKVVGLVVSLLIGGFLSWTVLGLLNPDSFFDFLGGLLVIPGAIIGIVASIAALRAKNTPAVESGEKESKIIRRVVAVVGALALLSAVLTFVGQEDVDDSEADVIVVQNDLEFDASEYALAPGSQVLVKNEDPFGHTFTIEALDIDEAINPGSEVLITIPDDASGEYILFCRPHTSDPDDPSEDDMAAKVDIS
jgi:plastocyanin